MNKKYFHRNHQSGFSMLELAIALTLIVVFMAAIASAMGPWMTFRQKMITDERLKMLSLVTHEAYRMSAGVADWGGDNGLLINVVSNANSITPATTDAFLRGESSIAACDLSPAGIDAQVARTKTNLAALKHHSSESMEKMSRDGFNQPLCVLVSRFMERDVPSDFETGLEGNAFVSPKIPHHRIAFLSAGADGAFDTETSFDENTGELLVNGDDMGVMVDGYIIQMDLYRETWKKITKVVKAYEKYARTQYKLNANRDVTTNYFYAGKSVNSGTGEVRNEDTSGAFIGDVNGDVPLIANTAELVEIGDDSAVPSGVELRNHIFNTSDDTKWSLHSQTAMEAIGLTESDTILPARPMRHQFIRMYNMQIRTAGTGIAPDGGNDYLRYPGNTPNPAAPCSMNDKSCRQFPIYSAMIQANVPMGGPTPNAIDTTHFRTIQMPVVGVFD